MCRFLVEDSFLLEYAEGIGIEYFCPFVTVVTCRIASGHDVGELNGHAGIEGSMLFAGLQLGFLPSLAFEGDDVLVELIPFGIVSHIQQSETHLAQAAVGHHEIATLADALNQFVGDGLACLIMEGKSAQELLFHGEVLHEL